MDFFFKTAIYLNRKFLKFFFFIYLRKITKIHDFALLEQVSILVKRIFLFSVPPPNHLLDPDMLKGYTEIIIGFEIKFFNPSFPELWYRQYEKKNFCTLKSAEGPQNPRIRSNYILTSLRIYCNFSLLGK